MEISDLTLDLTGVEMDEGLHKRGIWSKLSLESGKSWSRARLVANLWRTVCEILMFCIPLCVWIGVCLGSSLRWVSLNGQKQKFSGENCQIFGGRRLDLTL